MSVDAAPAAHLVSLNSNCVYEEDAADLFVAVQMKDSNPTIWNPASFFP